MTPATKNPVATHSPPGGEKEWILRAVTEMVTGILDERDRRYEERWNAQQEALRKVEDATEKRFESVNEFRKTLDDQQRTLMPRSEADVIFRGLTDKFAAMKETVDRLLSERAGIKGGWGYSVGVIGLILTILSIAALIMRALHS